MVVKVFCGEDFSEHEHEWKQFKEVCGLINEHYANLTDLVYILSDFLLSNAQIDVVILTQKGPAILELKSYKGEIFGSENGNWCVKTEDNEERLMNVNLFQQLKDQKFAFLEKLNSIRIGTFEHVDIKKLANIQCWGYFEKGSNYNLEQVGRRVHIWFDVITANNLIEKMKRSLNAGYLLRNQDMDAIVKGLNLKECDQYEKEEDISPTIKSSPVEQIIKKYSDSNNVIMLDAIYQWATNPTYKSAIKNGFIPEHEKHIKLNLTTRYGDKVDYDKIIEELKNQISKAGFDDFKVDYLQLKDKIEQIFDTENALYDETVKRVESASDLEQFIVWLCINMKELFPYYGDYSEWDLNKNKLNAIFVATLDQKPPDDMVSVLNQLGIINDLDYITTKGNNYYYHYDMPQYINKMIKEINISLPSPEFRNYIDSLFSESIYYEQLRLIDELSKNDHGVAKESELSGKLIPEKGIISTYAGYAAISPLILNDLKKYLTEKKVKCLSIHTDIKQALDGLTAKYPQEVGVTPQQFFGLDFEWEVICDETLGIRQNFGVILTPWITNSIESKTPSDLLKDMSEKTKYLVLIVTNQDIPSLIKLLSDSITLNLTILRIDENKIYVKKIGDRNELIEDFLEQLNKINYEIHTIGEQNIIDNETKPKKQIISEEKISEIKVVSEHINDKNHIIIGSTELPKQWGILGQSNNKKVILDLNAPHICFIAGMMGAGKGYTIGVISEMLASKSIPEISEVTTKATVIVLYKPKDDVPSEFWSIRFANDNQHDIQGLKAHDTEPKKLIEENQFKVFLDPGVYDKYRNTFSEEYRTNNIFPLYIDPSTLIAEDWKSSLAIGDGSDALYIKKLFKILRKLPPTFSINDVVKSINSSDLTKSQKGLALARLEILEEYFNKEDFINNLAIGGVNIIDFRKCMYQPDDIFTIMTLIISKLQNKNDFENHPFVFVMNEAHMYFKRGISKEFVDTIENLIRRKRHGANWLLLDTHLPTDVDSKVIELSDIKILHYTDKTVESTIFKRILEGSKEKLHELERGECIVFSTESSEGLSKPIKVKVRPRITKHGGETKTAI